MTISCSHRIARRRLLLAGLFLSAGLASAQNALLYGVSPGVARAAAGDATLSLSNQVLDARWSVEQHRLTGLGFSDPRTGEQISLPHDPFVLRFNDGTSLSCSAMEIIGSPEIQKLAANPGASRAAEHFAGQSILLRLQDPQGRLSVAWRVILHDGSNYLRQQIAISALRNDEPLAEVSLFDGKVQQASVVGRVKGSPVTAGDFFLGFEHPLAQCQAAETVTCSIKRGLPLRKGQTVRYSLVIGVSPAGQMRRGFLNYVERERAHPYRTFLHYNTWYDIGYGKPYDAAAVLDVIHAFGSELVRKRAVTLDSFLLDDGWDNPHSTWHVNPGFPGGLAPVNQVAREYGAALGVWLSPWGGYNEAKQERLDFGRSHGFETNQGGFALSGPNYYARFRTVSLDFIQERNQPV